MERTRTKPPRRDATALLGPAAPNLRATAAASALAALLWLPQAACLAWVFARLLEGTTTGLGTPVALFAVLGLLRAGLAFHVEARSQAIGHAIVAALRARILATAVASARDGAAGPGAYAALAAEKAEMALPFATRYVPARTRAALVPLAILLLAAWYSWAVAVVLLVSGPLIPVFMALVGLAAREASQRQMAQIGDMNDLLVDRLSALADVRLIDACARVRNGFAAEAAALRDRTMAVLRIAFLSSAVLEFFAAVGVAMVAVWCGFALLGALEWGGWTAGGPPITPFAAIWLLLLAPEFYQPLRDLSAAWHDKAAADSLAEEIAAREAENLPPILGSGGKAAPLLGPPTIRLRGVTASAPDRVLRYPDIDLRPGESLALMAPSGSGKTTLLRLIAGLEAPSSGTIDVAGRPLDPAHADGWRARLGWIPQAPSFPDATLRRVIGGARGGDITEALRRAALDDVVAGLPAGLDTRLGETGAGLSGGEARRVALARALHGRPDVVLADEPTADLDAETAARVTEGLLALARAGSSLVVATHDPALAARMDRILRLDGTA